MSKTTINPNPDSENTMIAQVLDAPRKSRKNFITNEVTLVFLDFLCTSVTCTLKRISLSGFGINLIFGTILLFASSLQAKTPKVNQILIVQKMISHAYEQGYVDSAPIEMGAVERKVILAKDAKKARNKKLLGKLIREIKSDLKIIEKRSEVNKLNLQLSDIQNKNLKNQQIFDELKEQL